MSALPNNLPQPLPRASETDIEIRFADVDMMRVVHHAAYLHWFEQIRFRFMANVLALDFDTLTAAGIMLPLISCNVEYKQSFRFTDKPVGYAKLQLFDQAKIALHYEIYKRDGWVLGARGTTVHCFLDGSAKLLLRTPKLIATALADAAVRAPECLLRGPSTVASSVASHLMESGRAAESR